jgi:hypothetical protein
VPAPPPAPSTAPKTGHHLQKTDPSALKEKALREKAADQQRQVQPQGTPRSDLSKPISFLGSTLSGAASLNPGWGAALIAGSRALAKSALPPRPPHRPKRQNQSRLSSAVAGSARP